MSKEEKKCPLCNGDIYISKYPNDYACANNKECPLYHGYMSHIMEYAEKLNIFKKERCKYEEK